MHIPDSSSLSHTYGTNGAHSSSSSSMKLSVTFVLLLLSGLLVFGEAGGAAPSAVECAAVRCIQGGYITCKNYPGKKLDGCVCAPPDGEHCVLHLHSGSSYKCGKTE
ncbi:hypothetical protein ACP4OV_026578 [Aristida adscensionis]